MLLPGPYRQAMSASRQLLPMTLPISVMISVLKVAAITSSEVKAVAVSWLLSLLSRLAVRPWGPFSSRVPGASTLLTGMVQWKASPIREFISSKVI